MKIVRGYPPNYEEIKKRFDLGSRHTVFTYGDTLYNPTGDEIPDHLMVHELTHTGQQVESSPKKWWNTYLIDSKFRLTQELEAYRMQYRFVKSKYNRKDQKGILKKISKDLSSDMYGGVITREDAAELIAEEKNDT